jgi:exonuclease III
MLWGGLPIIFGGLRPAKERLSQLAEFIKEQNPDIIFLQEMSFAPSFELFNHLQNEYRHCFTRIGPNPMRMESGLMVFSKIPIKTAEFFSFPNQNGINRGAFCLETNSKYFVVTHLEAGKAENDREVQLRMIVSHLEKITEEKDLQCFILGDFNIDSFESGIEYNQAIASQPLLFDPRREQNLGTESCTNLFTNFMLGNDIYPNPSEMVDYALFYGDRSELNFSTELIDTYSIREPNLAISDHKALVLKISSNY